MKERSRSRKREIGSWVVVGGNSSGLVGRSRWSNGLRGGSLMLVQLAQGVAQLGHGDSIYFLVAPLYSLCAPL